jgi:hypothetical protein
MQVPSELKPAAWGAVGGAIALAVVGFNRGWVTDPHANKTAGDAAWDWSWPYPSVWMSASNLCSAGEVETSCLQLNGIGPPSKTGNTLCSGRGASVVYRMDRGNRSATKNRVRHQQEASTRPSRRGQNAQVFGVPEAVLQRLERLAYLSGLQVHRRLA